MIAKVNIDMAGYFRLLKRTRCHLGAALAALFLFGPGDGGASAAEATPWTGMPETQARLIAASSAVGSDLRLTIGFQIRLAQGWKTYWRSPGDAGMPPQLDWSESQNLEDAEILWPAPKRFSAFDIDTFGYGDEVVFPILLRPTLPGRPVAVRLTVDYQVCKNICIPVRAELALDVPAGAGAETAYADTIRRFRQTVPRPSGDGPISFEAVRVQGPPGAQTLEVTARSERPFTAPDLIVEAPYPFLFDRPKVAFSEGGRRVVLRLSIDGGSPPRTLRGIALTLTVIDAIGAGETRVVAGAGG